MPIIIVIPEVNVLRLEVQVGPMCLVRAVCVIAWG